MSKKGHRKHGGRDEHHAHVNKYAKFSKADKVREDREAGRVPKVKGNFKGVGVDDRVEDTYVDRYRTFTRPRSFGLGFSDSQAEVDSYSDLRRRY